MCLSCSHKNKAVKSSSIHEHHREKLKTNSVPAQPFQHVQQISSEISTHEQVSTFTQNETSVTAVTTPVWNAPDIILVMF